MNNYLNQHWLYNQSYYNPKSPIKAKILVFFFGAFGFLYISVNAMLVMIFVELLLWGIIVYLISDWTSSIFLSFGFRLFEMYIAGILAENINAEFNHSQRWR